MSYLIIDGNSIGYAAQNATALTVDGKPVQAVYHSLQSVRRAVDDNPGMTPIVLWDGDAKFRQSLYPKYKANRSEDERSKNMREEYRMQRPQIQEALRYMGVAQIMPANFEADDVAGYLVRKSTALVKKSVLCTGDQDWLQLVNALTTWYDPRKETASRCDKTAFPDRTGVRTAKQFLQCKALIGDKSDNIEGIKQIGPKAAAAIMNRWGSVESMFEVYDSEGEFKKEDFKGTDLSRPLKAINRFCGSKDEREVFARNIALMDLTDSSRDADIAKDAKVQKGAPDLDAFLDFCGERKFASITSNIHRWKHFFEG